jgi:hypothetical protein
MEKLSVVNLLHPTTKSTKNIPQRDLQSVVTWVVTEK